MALNDYSDLNAMHLDVLREIGNIGTGNAATSLASMLQKPVNISVPTINVLDYEKVAEELGGPETMIVGIMLTISGEVNGMMMFLLEKDFAHAIVNDLLGGCFNGFHELDELSISALKEIGNISEKVIFIQDEFNGDAENMTSHILLIPTADSLQRIMRNLGVE